MDIAPAALLPVRPESLTRSHAGIPPQSVVPGLPGPTDAGTLRLGPPPARGSKEELADLDVVRTAVARRNPEVEAWAIRLDKEGAGKVWWDLVKEYGQQAGAAKGAAAAAVLGATLATNLAITMAIKEKHDRPRPSGVDQTIPALFPEKTDSYPSGHASQAFAAARVLSTFDSGLGARAYDLAGQVAESRVYAAVHFPSDVLAGAKLGTAVADKVLHNGGQAIEGAALAALLDEARSLNSEPGDKAA